MASGLPLNDEYSMSETSADIPVVREMLHELYESTASHALTSNTSLIADDLRVHQALALPESLESVDDIDVDAFTGTTSDTLVDALNSSSKCISIQFNSETSAATGEPEEKFPDTTTGEQIPVQQVIDVQPLPTQVTTTIEPPKKKRHIMISYNRSCEDDCRKIRNTLKKLKYKVWMDVYDMRDNFIDGMAKAINNSYIALMCINRAYDGSYWCRIEAENIAIKRINFIPCFMEKIFKTADWLDFLMGANVYVDFSDTNDFDTSIEKLISEITSIEEKISTNPRETPPMTPLVHLPSTTDLLAAAADSLATRSAHYNRIVGTFKTWVEENRHDLRRSNRKESAQLIAELIQEMKDDSSDDVNKKQFLQQLLLANSHVQKELLPQFFHNLITSQYPMIKGLLSIMALWAVMVVFKKQ